MIEIPVYVISGFLDAGKSTFIKPMLVSEDFTGGDKTLFLVCEQGEEEYDPARLARYYNVAVEYIENEEDLTTEKMRQLELKYRPDQILVEYNGMWSLAEFEQKMPPNWTIYQLIAIADANLAVEGRGHSVAIHSNNQAHIEQAAQVLPVSRFLINQVCATNNGGSLYNSLSATTTLGCGSWGGNTISENLSWKHLFNVSRIATVRPNAVAPTDDEIWG